MRDQLRINNLRMKINKKTSNKQKEQEERLKAGKRRQNKAEWWRLSKLSLSKTSWERMWERQEVRLRRKLNETIIHLFSSSKEEEMIWFPILHIELNLVFDFAFFFLNILI